MTIDAYVEAMKERFVTDPLVTRFQVLRERSTLMDGYLRARLALADGSQLEFSEYMQRSSAGEIVVITYSYHWADANNQLIMRWDNTPHSPDLPGFPDRSCYRFALYPHVCHAADGFRRRASWYASPCCVPIVIATTSSKAARPKLGNNAISAKTAAAPIIAFSLIFSTKAVPRRSKSRS
jgi:Family of unknown function (DUF6516)